MKIIDLIMKTMLKMWALCLFALVCCANVDAKNDKKKEAEVTFSVAIDCEGCKAKLEAKLPFVKGVKDLKVDLASQTVWFKYQVSKTDVQALEAAIEKLGYEAEEIKPEQNESEK